MFSEEQPWTLGRLDLLAEGICSFRATAGDQLQLPTQHTRLPGKGRVIYVAWHFPGRLLPRSTPAIKAVCGMHSRSTLGTREKGRTTKQSRTIPEVTWGEAEHSVVHCPQTDLFVVTNPSSSCDLQAAFCRTSPGTSASLATFRP